MEKLPTVQIVINEYKEAASCFLYIRSSLSSTYVRENRTWDMTEDALSGVRVGCSLHPSSKTTVTDFLSWPWRRRRTSPARRRTRSLPFSSAARRCFWLRPPPSPPAARRGRRGIGCAPYWRRCVVLAPTCTCTSISRLSWKTHPLRAEWWSACRWPRNPSSTRFWPPIAKLSLLQWARISPNWRAKRTRRTPRPWRRIASM